jgi:hypothetical protein
MMAWCQSVDLCEQLALAGHLSTRVAKQHLTQKMILTLILLRTHLATASVESISQKQKLKGG